MRIAPNFAELNYCVSRFCLYSDVRSVGNSRGKFNDDVLATSQLLVAVCWHRPAFPFEHYSSYTDEPRAAIVSSPSFTNLEIRTSIILIFQMQ